MFSKEDINIPDNNIDSIIKIKNVAFNTASEELPKIKCEFHAEEETIPPGILENQLNEKNVDRPQFFEGEFLESIPNIEAKINDKFSKEDVKVEYNEIENTEKCDEFNTSRDYKSSNIKCEFEEEETKILHGDLEIQLREGNKFSTGMFGKITKSCQKTEPTISNMLSKEDIPFEFCEVICENNEKNGQCNTSLGHGLLSIKCEFDEEESISQYGVLKNQLHKEKVTKYSTDVSTFQMLDSQLSKHMKIPRGEKPFKCETCGKSYSQKRNLTTHMKFHIGEKQYKCETCGNCFTRKGYLNIHMRIHTGERPYKCETCGQCYIGKGTLKRHMRIHTAEKSYKCETCSKCFRDKEDLIKHNTIHTEEKPYICETCGKRFGLKAHLSSHIRIHIGEKPYKCDTCGKCFSREDELIKHSRIHTGDKPYKCGTCEKCFNVKGNLNIHMRIHSGEMPYKCEICGRCFRNKSGMKKHIRIHTGEKPYKCETCGQCFSYRDTFKNHVMRIHTGKKS